MKPGPKPKPTALKKLEGNPSNRPLPVEEPEYESGSAESPWFGELKGDALAMWNYIVPIIKRVGLYTEVDPFMLSRYCKEWAEYIELSRFIEEKGITEPCYAFNKEGESIITSHKRRTESVRLRELDASMLTKETHMGFTPSSRTRVKADPKKKESASDQLEKKLNLA